MKTHSQEFKNQIKEMGRELDSKITYTIDNEEIELGNEQLNSITPHYEGNILKSVMKQLDIDSNVDIPVGTEINYQFGLKTIHLPSEYTRVDYIKNSGTQYIDTNFIPDFAKGFKIEVTFQPTNLTSRGCLLSNYDVTNHLSYELTNSGYQRVYINGGAFDKINGPITTGINEGSVEFLNGVVTQVINGSSYLNNYTFTNKSASSLYMFVDRLGRYSTFSNYLKIYRCKIYEEGNLIRDFIPCFRNSDDKVGMYDLVNKVFYTNQGSGEFTYGNETSNYEYINYGNYIVYSSEKKEDTRSYKIVAYDKMLYSMKDYKTPVINSEPITFPITIRNYINAICTYLGLTFANTSDTFTNYNKEIASELYLDENGNSLDYTFRDVLDELAQVTASTICINEDDELEIRYINQTQEKNLFNYKDTDTVTNDVFTIDEDGWITCTYDNTNGSSTKWCNYWTNNLDVNTSTKYYLFLEIKDGSGTGWLRTCSTGGNNQGQFDGGGNHYFNERGVIKEPITSRSSFNNIVYGLRTYVGFNAGNNGTITFRLSVIKENENIDEFSYEPYGETIDEEYLKDVNVNFGEKYGPINTISFKRSGDSDVISQSIPNDLADDEKIETAISDNQILNGNNRDEFIDGILNKLYGLEYYINDYSSTGICYLDLCDRYNVKVDDKFYSCIMFNDEVDITQGLEEKIHTDMPDESVTDYKKASSTDRKVNQAYIIVDKVNQEINAVTSETQSLSTQVTNNYNELLQSIQNLDTSVTQLDTRTTQVEQLQTDTYTKTEIKEIITGTNADGVNVTSLKSTSATFDEDGMHYAKTGALTSSTINQSGLEVDDNSGTQLLFAGYDEELLQALVKVANLYLTRYLGFENWRLEEVEDNEHGIGLGFFYTGGE